MKDKKIFNNTELRQEVIFLSSKLDRVASVVENICSARREVEVVDQTASQASNAPPQSSDDDQSVHIVGNHVNYLISLLALFDLIVCLD